MATAPLTCFATAAPGLEPLVARELRELGERPHVEPGGVEWRGDYASLMRANLHLRTASRVLVRIARFRATAFFELEKRARRIPWHDWLGPRESPDFRVTTHKSRLYHSDAIAQRLADAAGRERRPRQPVVQGAAGASDERHDASSQLFVVRVTRDEFLISADASGDLLHMRGYRRASGKAPLRETLAAALLLAAGWTGDTPLADPFCGSGTIPIEGALIARRIPPGLRREFAFMTWPTFDKTLWTRLLDAARSVVLADSPVEITGSDRDAGAIAGARENAQRAGVHVAFAEQSISDLTYAGGSGLVATNPPYGKRIGDTDRLRDLYARFGAVMHERRPGWRVALYAAGKSLAGHSRLRPTELFRTVNGGLSVIAFAADIGR